MLSVANLIKIFGIRMNGYRFTSCSLCIKIGRTVFSSASCKKDTKLSIDATKNVLKKRVIVKWNITNRKLFGPIIGNSKNIKDGDNNSHAYSIENVSSNKDNIDGSSKLLPVGLWGCQELFEKQIKRKQSPASTRAVQTSSILTGEETLENEEEQTSKLPDQPFFQKDGVVLPFPMLLGKRGAQMEPAPKEISSLTSPEENLPSVTQILKDTVSKESEMVLELWRKRKISEVGEEGFKEYMRGMILKNVYNIIFILKLINLNYILNIQMHFPLENNCIQVLKPAFVELTTVQFTLNRESPVIGSV